MSSGSDGVPRRRRRRPSMPPEGGRTDRAHGAPSVRPRATFRATRSRPAGGTAVAAFAPMAATVHSIKHSMLDCWLEVQCTRRSLAPMVTGDAGVAPPCSPAIRLAYATIHSEHRGTRCSCSRRTAIQCRSTRHMRPSGPSMMDIMWWPIISRRMSVWMASNESKGA